MNNFEISNLKSEILPPDCSTNKATLGPTITIVLATLFLSFSAFAQSTAFTYQGRLNHSGSPATGLYEITFALYDASTNGNVISTAITLAPIPVTNGLFNATLDLGPSAFTGAPRWLELSVTAYGSDQPVVTLAPRQPLTATPYALHAHNAANLMSFADAPLEIKVDGERALRLESNSSGAPNIIAGSHLNFAASDIVGATIAGGGAVDRFGYFIGANRVTHDFGTVSGGVNNESGHSAAVGGGFNNRAIGACSVIDGGQSNSIAERATCSVIGGGFMNRIDLGGMAVIAGGNVNAIETGGTLGTISGGGGNTIRSNAYAPVIAGGVGHVIESAADFSSIGGGEGSVIRANASASTISGGALNEVGTNASASTIAGGLANRISSDSQYGFIGSGAGNHIHPESPYCTLGGGAGNHVWEGSPYAFIGGGGGHQLGPNASNATIAGGAANQVVAEYGGVSSGRFNWVGSFAGVIGGGEMNGVGGTHGYVGGGLYNRAYATGSVISGGVTNTATGYASTVGGGRQNSGTGANTTVCGGYANSANGDYGTVPGGYLNSAGGTYSFAAGRRAKANHSGAFLWADGHDLDFQSSAEREFSARATGGVRFVTAIDTNGTPTATASLAPGSGSWSSLSDRNAKENFTPTQPREVLDKVAALPIATWNYKTQDKSIRHIGPTAQDFRAAFNVGENDRTITTVDADGVALAAIQGLNQKLEAELKTKDAQIRQLQSDLAEVKQLLQTLATR